MKTSLKKLHKFTTHRHEKRAQRHNQSLSIDEHARATQDLIDMRGCYDRLLSAAAATANSVYEFSESLREMGDCLLEKTALNDDEESGKVLLMLGKVQFELQRLVDGYRSHIFQTITIPSESLLNELRIVEEMKKRCDEKREIYEDLAKRQKEKMRLRNSKTECFSSNQLQQAHDEYDEEANVFVFRMKSLKQGQSRSFLTQSSRHHAAQLYFFKKAVRSLEAIEPHVSLLAEQLHIDYHFSGLYDAGHGYYYDESDDYTDDDSDTNDDRELSFDYGKNGPAKEASALKNSMELDNVDVGFSPDPKLSTAKEISQVPRQNSYSFQRGVRAVSKSAPLFPPKKFDSSERPAHIGPSPSNKFTSYVLPTPNEAKSPSSGKLVSEAPQTRQTEFKYERARANVLSGPIILGTQSVLKDSNSTPKPPPRLSESISLNKPDPNVASYAKKAKRQAFSGPLTGKPWPNNPSFSASGPIGSSLPPPISGSLLRNPFPRATSTTKMPSHAPNFVSSPKISELHELPRPPANLASRRTSSRYGHSGPLLSKSHEMSATRVSPASVEASKLPVPPHGLSRSYSIPAGGPVETELHAPLEDSENVKMAENDASPPLMPISLPMPNHGNR